MKNLNEQIERMNRLFEYKVGIVISEQQTPEVKSTPEKNSRLGYFITAGASNTPMRSVTLSKNQKFPLPKDAKPTDVYMYEIKLSDALNDNFSVATVLNKVDEKNRDQIIFGNESIVNTGTIRIPINQSTINQTIKVSGNGALVLSRATNDYQLLKKLGGIMALELSAKELYSKTISVETLGVTQQNLVAKANSTLSGLIYQLNNETGKSELDPNLTKYQSFPDQFWVSIKDLSGKVIPANIKWSDKINSYKNTLDKSNYKSKYGTIAKVIKTGIITPGLNQLPSTVSKFLSTNFPSLPKDILDQFVVSLNTIIKSTDDQISVEYIKKYFDDWSYVKTSGGVKSPTPTPGVKTTDTKYKEGQG
jgi:hypothetical protein